MSPSTATATATATAIATPPTPPAAEPSPQAGTIAGCVTYRPGEGAPIEIPMGPIEVTLAPDSATLSWDAGDGVAGLTAMPKIQFDDYLGKGLITLGAANSRGHERL